MLPRLGTSKFVSQWILATLAASILTAIGAHFLYHWLALVPARVFRGEVWRLVSWPLLELGPIGLVVTCIAIYKFGGELAVRWGDRRLRRFVLEITLLAGVITCVLAAIAGVTYLQRIGGFALMDALVIAWARQFPNATLVLYGMLAVRGRQLVMITVGVNVVIALYTSPVLWAPELVACGAAALYPRWLLHR